MFGTSTSTAFRPTTLFGATSTSNPMKDFEVIQPPDDTIQCLKFSPPAIPQNFLVSGSWANDVRVWEIKQDGSSEPKAQQTLTGPVFEADWYDDGTKIFVAGADKTVRVWDLASNQMIQLGQHDQPVKSCHWIKSPTYNLLMTGSWDKTLKFWDPRTPGTPVATLTLPERVYCADVMYPMAAVALANRQIKVYKLDGQPQEVKQIESPLKFQSRCLAIFKDPKTSVPTGFALGSIEGRVAIQLVEANNPKDNFTFKCHRSPELNNGFQDIFAVNDVAFHPVHGTLATVGSDGRFSFWDKDARTKLKTSEKMEQPITRCCFNKGGEIFAYAVGYDWSKGHEYYNPQAKNYVFLHPCFDDMKPRPKTS